MHLNICFFKEDTIIARKHTQKSFTLFIRKIQMETTMRYHFIFPRMAIIKEQQNKGKSLLARMWRNCHPCMVVVGMSNGEAVMKKNLAVLGKLNIDLPHGP